MRIQLSMQDYGATYRVYREGKTFSDHYSVPWFYGIAFEWRLRRKLASIKKRYAVVEKLKAEELVSEHD